MDRVAKIGHSAQNCVFFLYRNSGNRKIPYFTIELTDSRIIERMMKVMKKLVSKIRGKFYGTVGKGYTVAVSALGSVEENDKLRIAERTMKVVNIATCVGVAGCMAGATFAAPSASAGDPATTVLQNMITLIEKVFKYVGIILAVYSIGQLVMAFKNEDADSKSRATTMLVVACVLIGIQKFVSDSGITDYLTK